MDEVTAYHESGHAVVALTLGGTVESVSVEVPSDWAAGDTRVIWRGNPDSRQFCLNEIRVALAGPIAEMVFVGDYDYLRIKAEHEIDWRIVASATARLGLTPDKTQRLLGQYAADLYRQIRQDHLWSAIGDIADRLQIDGTLDGETVAEVVAFWLRRAGMR